MHLPGETGPQPACCETSAQAFVDRLIVEEGAKREAVGQFVLSGIGEKYPRLWRGALADASVQVIELRPPAAAMRFSVQCQECGRERTIIVIASQVLLTLQRLTLLFGETMTVVRDQGPAHVTFLEPADDQVAEFRSILSAYVSGEQVGHPKSRDISERWATVDAAIGADLRHCAELGQLWIVGHEIGHGFGSERFHERLGYPDHREPLAADLHEMFGDLGPRTLRLWAEELNADIFATALLYETIMDGVGLGDPAPEVRSRVTRYLAVSGPREEAQGKFIPSHPPAHIRWQFLSRFLMHLGGAGDEASLMFLAQIVGRASQGFLLRARPRHLKGLPEVH
jgi:hypothetical protein